MSSVQEESDASVSNVSWEHIDQVLELQRSIRECHMRYMTCSRRSFAFEIIYKFLFDYLTERRSVRGHEWCPAAVSRNLLSAVRKCIMVTEERKEHCKLMLDHLLEKKIREKHTKISPLLVASRHTELSDPDKKIWKRMYDAGIAPSKIIEAYEEVKGLLPNEAVANYETRTGKVNCLVEQSNCGNTITQTYGDTLVAEHLTITPREFYERYMRSDIVVAKSNKISEAFSEYYEILPGKLILVPRRIERYLNVEMEKAIKNSTYFLTNYIRGIVVAYSVGEMFGVAFPATQLYLMGFARSASAACGDNVLGTSVSKLKGILRSMKLFSASPAGNDDHSSNCFSGCRGGRSIFPESLSFTKCHKSPRDLIVSSLSYMPDRKVKSAVAYMRSPVAEHEPDGYMAVWLALAISRVLGRGVSANYAILFLANWAARQYQIKRTQISEQRLIRLFVSVGLTFEQNTGMVVPVVGFGSGMTNSRLKTYAINCLRNFIKTLLDSGRAVMGSDCNNLTDVSSSLEQMSARLFKNSDVVTLSSSTGDDDYNLKSTLESMRGVEFFPSEERRQIHEEEYTKTLNRKLKLRLRFGVCGYQHPLPASGDKNSLVKLQLLKHRKTYIQRETAAAINWDRMLQFFFPRRSSLARPEIVGPHTTIAMSRLKSLSRHFVELISIALKSALPCERALDDIGIKFNSDILTLGRKPDHFLRQKAGLVIGQHAVDALEVAYHQLGRFAESRAISHIHISELASHSDIGREAIEMAHGCVTAKDHQQQYNKFQSFIPTLKDTSFEPIPFYGIENPIYPPKDSYEDKTAIRCNETESAFWVRETNGHMIDALLSRGILSFPRLEANRKRDGIILESDACVNLYRDIGRLNHKELISDKPRKSDPTPWSSKNTGQAGRSVTEFSPNSIIVLSIDCNEKHVKRGEKVRGNNGHLFEVGGVDDVFLAAIETQHTMAQNDILYPERKSVMRTGKPISLIKAPDISPVFRHGGKPAVITLRHGSCHKAGVISTSSGRVLRNC